MNSTSKLDPIQTYNIHGNIDQLKIYIERQGLLKSFKNKFLIPTSILCYHSQQQVMHNYYNLQKNSFGTMCRYYTEIYVVLFFERALSNSMS